VLKRVPRNDGEDSMTSESGVIRVQDLGKTYSSKAGINRVLDGLTFDIPSGQFLAIVGPSGAGKTTLLRCLTGLLKPTEGSVFIDGQAINGPSSKMSVVFQEYTRSLMPWMSVTDNVELALQARGVGRSDRAARAAEALEQVGLHDAGDRYPWQLSGGMQQRVAIARAMVTKPEVLVMDEPFASVDAQTKLDLEDLVMDLQQSTGTTVILVTHDIDEAVYLADRVLVLSKNPCRVQADITVPIPRPRDQVTSRSMEAFTGTRAEILTLIRRPAA
jgi:NitT/TauT family transport system ATP-binding protein